MIPSAGELIWRCRKYKGITMRELAEQVGTSHKMIWCYEHGTVSPRFDMVVWCLEACGFTLELKEPDDEIRKTGRSEDMEI